MRSCVRSHSKLTSFWSRGCWQDVLADCPSYPEDDGAHYNTPYQHDNRADTGPYQLRCNKTSDCRFISQ